jgi:hypothetical protein
MAKVLIKLQTGEEIRGNLLSFNPKLPSFYVQVGNDREKAENITVSTGAVKAIFFLKKESGDDSILHMETIAESVFAGTCAVRLHVEFEDGEMIHGSAHKYSPNDAGFYLVPLNPADRYERIYVNALAAKKVDSKRLMGKILVDQKKITEAQLEHALQHQREKRDKKIGTILREHHYITHDQLEESLQKQEKRAKFLGEILLEAGYITEDQLQSALSVQHENRKKKLGQILVELKYIAPNDICIALATQFHLPWADLSVANVPPEIATTLPEDVERELEVIPVERKDNTLVVASAEPQVPGLIGVISRFTDLKIQLAVAYEGYIESAINRSFPKKEGP